MKLLLLTNAGSLIDQQWPSQGFEQVFETMRICKDHAHKCQPPHAIL